MKKPCRCRAFLGLERAKGIEPFCLVCRSVSKRVVTGFPANFLARFGAVRHSDFDTLSTPHLQPWILVTLATASMPTT